MSPTPALIINALFLLSIAVLLVWMLQKTRQAKRSQDRLIESLERSSSDSWFRVNVSRPLAFSKKWKWLGFEAKGLVINSPDRVRILAETWSGERIDNSYPKRELGLKWIGNSGIASANMHWISIGHPGDALIVSADTGMNALQSREATADLCRVIDPGFQLPAVATSDFALEKNPASLAAVFILFGVLLFAFLDGVILNEKELLELGNAKWGIFLVPLVVIPFYVWLSQREVPSRESITLAMLVSLAFTFSYVPAVKRIDQILAESGPSSIEYRLGEDTRFKPVLPGPPEIDYSSRKEYWERFEEGSIHAFDLVHGPLGLWQLDHARFGEEIRKFYESYTPEKGSS